MSYQNPATFSPYTPPPDEQKSNRNSVRYAPIPSSSTTASTSASASANPFAGVYKQTEQFPDAQIRINKYETGLPIRVDIEAALAYALGCVTAYVDGITLERFELPIFGTLASSWVDSE
ncbi:12579_t:CDS:2 [Funneliformis geosporum]|uniref:1979_t:CDS:1 n=1 Tax=Funneliformis geosporum TaxID=1117311 RepID=A0A9W4SH97_9GLOM|nr:12579_t:CDS:2 [Funneliformis geosporum]CAI2168885.1 1979_t:CDS:2 [Funneliformis geosporum]